VALTTHPHLALRLKKEYSYIFTSPLELRDMFKCEFYNYENYFHTHSFNFLSTAYQIHVFNFIDCIITTTEKCHCVRNYVLEIQGHNYCPQTQVSLNSAPCYPSASMFNHSKTKCQVLYLKTQFVPRCKHFSSRL